jgi:hypothetical protein
VSRKAQALSWEEFFAQEREELKTSVERAAKRAFKKYGLPHLVYDENGSQYIVFGDGYRSQTVSDAEDILGFQTTWRILRRVVAVPLGDDRIVEGYGSVPSFF